MSRYKGDTWDTGTQLKKRVTKGDTLAQVDNRADAKGTQVHNLNKRDILAQDDS